MIDELEENLERKMTENEATILERNNLEQKIKGMEEEKQKKKLENEEKISLMSNEYGVQAEKFKKIMKEAEKKI